MRNTLDAIAAGSALLVFALSAAAQTPSEGAAPVALDREGLETWLDGVVPPALEQGDIAGLVVSVVSDGQVLLAKGYGYADVTEKVPMDARKTLVRAASISKSFTATAVMQQVEAGTLDLDRNVNDYLDFEIPPAFGQPITLRHLLTHTAGFAEISYKRHSPPLTLRERLQTVPARIYPPGVIPAYSNYGMNLAGYIVERVTGESLADYVERRILEPLDMTRSTFRVTLPDELQPFMAKSYEVASAGDPYPANLMIEMLPVPSPSAGLSTTARDMTRFMLAHLQGGRYGNYQLLEEATVERMHAPAFVPIEGAQPVALGLFRTDYKGHRVIGHSGDGEGWHTGVKLLADEDVGVFMATNSDGTLLGMLPAAFSLRETLFEQFVDRYFPSAADAQEPRTTSTAREHARIAAGEYVWSRQPKGDYREALFLIARFLGLDKEIRVRDDGTIETTPFLTLESSGKPQQWREVAPFVWREVGGDAHLVMKVEDGRVRSVWSDAVASFWVNLRVPLLWSAGLNVPLLLLSTAVLLLTALSWPVAALVRRRYGRPPDLTPRERRARTLMHLAAIAGVIYVLGWLVAMVTDAASTVGAEPWIRLLQLIGLLCVGGAGLAIRHAWLVLRGKRGGWSTAWSIVVVLALLYLVWFSFAFHLISVRLG